MEWVPFAMFGAAAFVKQQTQGFFEGPRPTWQKLTAVVSATITAAGTLGLAWVGLAAFTTDLRELPRIVEEHEAAGPLPELRDLAEQAVESTDALRGLLEADICERNDVPSFRCSLWLERGRPDNLRRSP